MRVLVACEFSGIVRDAFTAAGHYAVSCDLLETESPGMHHVGDARDLLRVGWDLLIAHPPCTLLSRVGVRWLTDPGPSTPTVLKGQDRIDAIPAAVDLFMAFLCAPIPRVAVENPKMLKQARDLGPGDPTQIVQPWMHGHPEKKGIGLWLRGLPPLVPTDDVRATMLELPTAAQNRSHRMPPGPNRAKERSRFYPGVARAMAEQWGRL